MADLETRQEYEAAHGTARYWEIELGIADEAEKQWREDGKAVVERYRAESTVTEAGREKKFNILWSNTETLKGALFARMAKPDVRRRYLDQDPVGRQVAEVLERGIEYGTDVNDWQPILEGAVEDSLLAGRGVAWVVYDVVKSKVEVPQTEIDPATGAPIETMVEEEYIGKQECLLEYVHWEDYRQSPAKRPEDVRWKARRHIWSRDELRENFPGFKNIDDVPLNWTPDADKDFDDAFKRAEVWEIWDKTNRQRIYSVKGYPENLLEEDDPYQLENFFPTPKPLTSVTTNDTTVPVPEFHLYQDQADELDRITTRINRLVEALKRRGLYDAAYEEMSRIADAGDNEFIPSNNFQSLLQSGGLQSAIQTEDITPIAVVLNSLYEQRNQLIQTIYEVTGISDVIRGATDPNETATAQKLKGQFGSMRLKRRQNDVQRYVRDLFRIKAEIMAEHYEPYILSQMVGIEVTDEMIEVMRDDKLRSYRIDIETDSTVFEDAEQEKNSRIELVNTMGAYLEKALPVSQASPELTPMLFEALDFMVRGFHIGRSFEDVIEETKQNVLQAQQAAQQQPPQPDPEMIKAQQDAQMAQAKLQQEGQLGQLKLQQEGQLKGQELQMNAALKEHELGIEAELEARKQDVDAANVVAFE